MTNRNGAQAAKLRRAAATLLPCPCWRCGLMVTADMKWDADHTVALAEGGKEYGPDVTVMPAHRTCNRRHGQMLKTRKENSRKTGQVIRKPIEVERQSWW